MVKQKQIKQKGARLKNDIYLNVELQLMFQ